MRSFKFIFHPRIWFATAVAKRGDFVFTCGVFLFPAYYGFAIHAAVDTFRSAFGAMSGGIEWSTIRTLHVTLSADLGLTIKCIRLGLGGFAPGPLELSNHCFDCEVSNMTRHIVFAVASGCVNKKLLDPVKGITGGSLGSVNTKFVCTQINKRN